MSTFNQEVAYVIGERRKIAILKTKCQAKYVYLIEIK
jgi:hypothetical protein